MRKINEIKSNLNLLKILGSIVLSITTYSFINVYLGTGLSSFLLSIAFVIIIIPIFSLKDIFHPIIVFNALELLVLFHFFFKLLLNDGNRYSAIYSINGALIIYLLWYVMFYLGYFLWCGLFWLLRCFRLFFLFFVVGGFFLFRGA